MSIMEVGIEISLGKDASAEIVLDVDFDITAEGCSAHMGGPGYVGHPAEPMEIEIHHVYWPYSRKLRDGERSTWSADKVPAGHTVDHIVLPLTAIPDDVYEGIVAYICEHYDDGQLDPARLSLLADALRVRDYVDD